MLANGQIDQSASTSENLSRRPIHCAKSWSIHSRSWIASVCLSTSLTPTFSIREPIIGWWAIRLRSLSKRSTRRCKSTSTSRSFRRDASCGKASGSRFAQNTPAYTVCKALAKETEIRCSDEIRERANGLFHPLFRFFELVLHLGVCMSKLRHSMPAWPKGVSNSARYAVAKAYLNLGNCDCERGAYLVIPRVKG